MGCECNAPKTEIQEINTDENIFNLNSPKNNMTEIFFPSDNIKDSSNCTQEINFFLKTPCKSNEDVLNQEQEKSDNQQNKNTRNENDRYKNDSDQNENKEYELKNNEIKNDEQKEIEENEKEETIFNKGEVLMVKDLDEENNEIQKIEEDENQENEDIENENIENENVRDENINLENKENENIKNENIKNVIKENVINENEKNENQTEKFIEIEYLNQVNENLDEEIENNDLNSNKENNNNQQIKENEEKSLKPSDNFSLYLFEHINKLRENPKYLIEEIQNAKSKIIKDKKGRIIYNGKVKVALGKGEVAFDETIKILNETTPCEKLKFSPIITVDLPKTEEEVKNKNYLNNKFKEMDNNEIYIRSYWRDIIKDPETCFLLMIIDDTGSSNAGNKRRDLLNKDMKYIGITSVTIGKSFACYLTLSNQD